MLFVIKTPNGNKEECPAEYPDCIIVFGNLPTPPPSNPPDMGQLGSTVAKDSGTIGGPDGIAGNKDAHDNKQSQNSNAVNTKEVLLSCPDGTQVQFDVQCPPTISQQPPAVQSQKWHYPKCEDHFSRNSCFNTCRVAAAVECSLMKTIDAASGGKSNVNTNECIKIRVDYCRGN